MKRGVGQVIYAQNIEYFCWHVTLIVFLSESFAILFCTPSVIQTKVLLILPNQVVTMKN